MAFQNQRRGVRLADRLSQNHKLLYQYIRTQGPMARADLVRISELTFPSISRMVAELLEHGLVQETTQRRGGMGKPPTELVLVPETACALGVALGEARAQGVVIDAVGTILEQAELENPESNDLETVQTLVEKLGKPAGNLIGIGVTRAGRGLEEQEHESLEGTLGLEVTTASQAGAGAQRERYFGAAQTLDTFLYLNVGGGLSSAAMLGRRLLASPDQLGSLAAILGGQLGHGDEAWSTTLPLLSTTILASEQLLAPEALVIGGDVNDALLDDLRHAMEAQLNETLPARQPVPQIKGFSGPQEPALAAATLPLYRAFDVAAPDKVGR